MTIIDATAVMTARDAIEKAITARISEIISIKGTASYTDANAGPNTTIDAVLNIDLVKGIAAEAVAGWLTARASLAESVAPEWAKSLRDAAELIMDSDLDADADDADPGCDD